MPGAVKRTINKIRENFIQLSKMGHHKHMNFINLIKQRLKRVQYICTSIREKHIFIYIYKKS